MNHSKLLTRFGAIILAISLGLVNLSAQTGQSSSADTASDSGVSAAPTGLSSDNENFQADLFTGRFTYSVPIMVPPGRQGAEPKLTLGYNSSGANGWCGVGWSLDVGYIQRDTRHGVPVLWNSGATNTSYSPQYDDSKGFIANFGGVSSPLVLVSATNAYPLVYRQQVETAFLTYNYYTTSTSSHWEVVDKSGNIFYFGENTNSQMENPKPGWTSGVGPSTFRWALDKVADVNSNETFLNYRTDIGMLYLTNIMYNANSNLPAIAATHEVDFILVSNRPDTNISFISGFRVATGLLLGEVDTKVSGTNVSKYVLGYTNSPSTMRSLLASVTRYGSDFSSSLPPITFSYQVQSFQFGPDTVWGGVQTVGEGSDNPDWSSIRSMNSSGDILGEMVDMDGDGLPDRVYRQTGGGTYTNFFVQRNTGTNFLPAVNCYQWGALNSLGNTTGEGVNSPTAINISENDTHVDLIDINGDGYPDRVMIDNQPWTNFWVQLNTGLASVSNGLVATDVPWTNVVDNEVSDNNIGNIQWFCPRAKQCVDMVDMNGDGLPDRVTREVSGSFDSFKIQMNTGSGFLEPALWTNVSTFGAVGYNWNSISSLDNDNNQRVILMDINGDGLPDRVMRTNTGPYTTLWVQYNNGTSFESPEPFGIINTQGNDDDPDWGSPICTDGNSTRATLVDINGDGLPDRVMRKGGGTDLTNWWVQINTGSGFGPTNYWAGVDSQGLANNTNWNGISSRYTSGNNNLDTVVDFFDINGDGLPDRVMRVAGTPYDHWVVQTNMGPFPDLMCTVSNGLGGATQISYVPSTTLDNRNTNWTTDPWSEGTKSLLPFNVWVVSQIVTYDGMGSSSTNGYAFTGGYYNAAEREFRGFSKATVTDPMGTTNITYFHQSGGRDNTALGEYQDQGSESKKGIPYRIDVIGTNGSLNKITFNKVEEFVLSTNGWFFPAVVQTIVMNYEGLSSYRATAKQLSYDTNTGNLIEEADLGEVGGVSIVGQTCTDLSTADNIYTFTLYASLSNPSIVNKPSDIKITSDSGGSNRLRETLMSYDSRGNLTTNQAWLDTAGGFITKSSTIFDQYGNAFSTTDAAGVTTATTYDTAYQQYPVLEVAASSFTNSFIYDSRSGAIIMATDVKGEISSNVFDVFFRGTASYISTNTSSSAGFLWRSKTTYSMGPISNGITTNFMLNQLNDGVDPVNGLETFTYFDGLGRPIERRTEAETSGNFRVVNTFYDLRGSVVFQTLPYISSGINFTIVTGTPLGALTEYDPIGRTFRETPSVQGMFSGGLLTSTLATGGDIGSPVGSTTTSFVDGSNPWAKVIADAENKVKKLYYDARGRVTNIVEATSGGNIGTFYAYDLMGNLTNVTDNATNQTSIICDSFGRKTSTIDADMGTWRYSYDNAGRPTEQIDARSNKLTFSYSDPIGRITSKQIYNPANQLVGTVTYTYDVSDDQTHYPAVKGMLTKVVDLQGYEKYGYDGRGRVIATDRHLNVNSMDYATQTTYDDGDHVTQLVYPNNAATIGYSYDIAGHLTQVRSLAGTGTQECFYTAIGFNKSDQLLGYTNGNGVLTTNIYYPNSARIQRVIAYKATTNQDLTYCYDKVSDVTNVQDGVYSGTQSGSISSIQYDDLHRLIFLNSTARGIKTYSYDSIGDVVTNQDFGSGCYTYGAKPHAVTNANGISYSYDGCGNMTARGSQTLIYDAQNELTSVSDGITNVTFGYADGGERLWRCGTNGYSVWIGGIYEINNGKVLCHVFASGKRVATFEPICGGPWAKAVGERRWFTAMSGMDKVMAWPFQGGRAPLTMVILTLGAMAGVCIAARKHDGVVRPERLYIRKNTLYYQIVSIVSVCILTFVSTPDVEAQIYNPVFYYYHADDLSSSNVLTDRSGNRIQHYEYTAFGHTAFTDNSSAFPISNRYTSQVADDETGLYYYGARYYDPQLGRFIQADTIVPREANSQALNRYAYCDNNPLNEIDPSGHGFFSQVAGFFSSVFNAEASYWSSPKTWENIGIGFGLGGPIGAAGAAVLGHATTEIGASFGYIFGAQVGNDAAFAAAIAGTIVLSALGCAGTLGSVTTVQQVLIGSSAALNISSESAGYVGDTDLSEDLRYANLALSAYSYYASVNNGPLPQSDYDPVDYAMKGLGYVMNIPNDAIGLAIGGLGKLIDWNGEQVSFGHNGIQFTNNPLCGTNGDITFGNVMNFGPGYNDTHGQFIPTGPDDPLEGASTSYTYGQHEMQHTFQGAVLGPLFVPAYGAGMIGGLVDNPYGGGALFAMFGPANFMEMGPWQPELNNAPSRPWP